MALLRVAWEGADGLKSMPKQTDPGRSGGLSDAPPRKGGRSLAERRSADRLPGQRDQRVFIGGQYDFMPTLREISQFLEEISCEDKVLIPIIAYDFDMSLEDILATDLQILRSCRYAIFDVSDLGAQLVEMHEAYQNRSDIDTLIVYPVRERRNQPQRGEKTILSFRFPHFGYRSFEELKGVVWRFVTKTSNNDYSPRIVRDPILDRELRRARMLLSDQRWNQAQEVLDHLLRSNRYKGAVEAWLQLALVAHFKPDVELMKKALNRARAVARGDTEAEAEVSFYRGLIGALNGRWNEARRHLTEAVKKRPRDGRTLNLRGYVLRRLGHLDEAIASARKALDDMQFPDPVPAVNALNNLAYWYCLKYEQEGKVEVPLLTKALDHTVGLPGYDQLFPGRGPTWLHTRGRALYLAADLAEREREPEQAKRLAKEAGDLLSLAKQRSSEDPYDKDLREARELEQRLAKVKV